MVVVVMVTCRCSQVHSASRHVLQQGVLVIGVVDATSLEPHLATRNELHFLESPACPSSLSSLHLAEILGALLGGVHFLFELGGGDLPTGQVAGAHDLLVSHEDKQSLLV